MAISLASRAAATHHERLQDPFRPGAKPMAKADLKKVQKREGWAYDGAICANAIKLARLDNKEAAGLLDLSEQSLSAQLAGAERPQTELFRACSKLRGPYLVAQAMAEPELFDTFVNVRVRL